jgi:hypothetical protein
MLPSLDDLKRFIAGVDLDPHLSTALLRALELELRGANLSEFEKLISEESSGQIED